ncbi:MAG: DNA-directed DNA polymerase I [Candidatus Heimdallarchaeaceae archaeon]
MSKEPVKTRERKVEPVKAKVTNTEKVKNSTKTINIEKIDRNNTNNDVQSEVSSKTDKYVLNAPENLPPCYLLDVKYDGKSGKAYLKLYNPKDQKIYRWYDNTNHLPYLLTTLDKTEVERLLPKNGKKEYLGCETVAKYDLLKDKKVHLTKVLASNPLAIGGRRDSFREYIKPAYEADIRYHLNYIYDNNLVPGLLYSIKNGKLVPSSPKIPEEIIKQINAIFAKQSSKITEIVERYLPVFFSPIPEIKRCAVDIETSSTERRVPNPNDPIDKVISIGFADTDGNIEVYVLNEENRPINVKNEKITIIEFSNEKDMLIAAFEKISSYPIIVTFNGDNFDFAYLDGRARKLEIDKKYIPFVRTRTQDIYLSYGLHIDLYRFFRQAAMRIYAFGGAYDRVSLEELASGLLGKHKLEVSDDIWQLELEELIEYNARDAEITLELTTFNNNQAIEIIFMLSRITKMPIDDFIRTSVSIWVQNWLYYEHRQMGYLIPRKEDILSLKGGISTEAIIKGKKYQGAIVIEPKAGVWWNVYVLDFASLYPSLIKTRNLSYETINCRHPECKKNRVPETGHWICTKKAGISSLLIGFIRDVRVYWFKKRVKDQSLSAEERKMSSVIQSSLKVLINASYGVFGSENFALYCPPVAESTTALARDAITKARQYCEKNLGLTVLYGDTDSIFILNPKPEQIEELEKWSMETLQIELSTDYVFRYCGLSGRKKNYFGITVKGTPIVKGLLGKKKNTPELIKKPFKEILQILSEVQNPEELEKAKKKIIRIVRGLIAKVEKRQFNVKELAISMTLSKKLSQYDSWTQPLQAAIQLMQAFPNKEPPTVGSTISFVKTKPFKIQIPRNTVSEKVAGSTECSVKPIELATTADVDIQKIKELIESTFMQLLDTIGISWNDIQGQTSLTSWFG